MSQGEVERRCGWSRGYLSQVLCQRVNLNLRHVLSTLSAIGKSPAEFFAGQFQPTQLTDLLHRLERYEIEIRGLLPDGGEPEEEVVATA